MPSRLAEAAPLRLDPPPAAAAPVDAPDPVTDDEPHPRRRAPGRTRAHLFRVTVTAVVAWAVLMVVAIGGVVTVHSQRSVDLVRDEAAEVTNAQVLQLLTNSESAVRGYQLTGLRQFLDPYEQARVPLQAALDRLDDHAADHPELSAAVATQRRSSATWVQDFAQPMAAGDDAVSTAAAQQRARQAFDAVRDANAAVQRQLAARVAADRRAQQLGTGIGVGVLVLLGVVAAIGLVRPTQRTVAALGTQLADLEGTVGRLRSGDLRARADASGAPGELRDVALALNDFAERTEFASGRAADEVRLSQSVVELSHRMTTTLDLDQVAAETTRWLAEQLDSVVWMKAYDTDVHQEGRGRAVYPPELDQAAPSELLALARRINEQSWGRQGTVLVTPEHPGVATVCTAEEGQSALDHVARRGVSTLLFVPIGAGQQALGYITLGRRSDQPLWTDLERKAAQEIGREAGRAVLLARLFERDQDLIGKLAALETHRNDFVSMASHALRTPLASIAGYLEVMRSGDMGEYDPGLLPAMEGIDRNSRRLIRMADDFLLLSQLEEGTRPHRPVPVDLQAICRAAVDSQSDRARTASQSVILTVHGKVAALGVAEELTRAVDNLLGNALKFSAVGESVRLRVRDDAEAGVAVLELNDTGLGLAEADLPRLFTRYFRGAAAISAEIPGMGLGLRITKLVIDKHLGSITISSSAEHGTTFRIELPRAELVERSEPEAQREPTPEEELAEQEAAGVELPAGVKA